MLFTSCLSICKSVKQKYDVFKIDRRGISHRSAEALASEVLYNIGIIPPDNLYKVIDRRKVRRKRGNEIAKQQPNLLLNIYKVFISMVAKIKQWISEKGNEFCRQTAILFRFGRIAIYSSLSSHGTISASRMMASVDGDTSTMSSLSSLSPSTWDSVSFLLSAATV